MKLERVFAKPFVGSLDGHKDAVSCISKHPLKLSILLSAAFDGEIKVWNLPQKKCERSFLAHDGIVRAISFSPNGEHFLTIGDDKTIKTWKAEGSINGEQEDPTNTIVSKVNIKKTFIL